MQFLSDLYVLSEAKNKAKDLSILPEDVIKEIKKNIRDGAKDLDYEWANALEMVQQAFKIAGVERPTPSEKDAWKQYEELLQYGVNEMADSRGHDNSWRMSSTVFREAMEKRIKVRVYEVSDKFATGHTVEAKNMEEIIEMIRKQAGQKSFDMDVVGDPENGECVCKFSYQGIQRPYQVKLQRL